MYCPKCGAHYKNEFAESCECHVPLVEEPPDSDEPTGGDDAGTIVDHPEPVLILETSDEAELLVARSLLDEARILHHLDREGTQDLIGYGRLFAGYNVATGPIRLLVEGNRAEDARELLAGLEELAERHRREWLERHDSE